MKLLAAHLPWLGGPGRGLGGLAFHALARPPEDLLSRQTAVLA